MGTPPYDPETPQGGDGVTLAAILHVLVEKGWVIALFLALCIGAGFAYVQQAESLFTARAILQVEQREPTAIGGGGGMDAGDLRAADLLRTVEQNLTIDSLYERVVEALDLRSDPGFIEHVNGNPPSMGAAIHKLASRVVVKVRRGTRLLDIWVDDTDPERAKNIAQALVNEAMRQQFELRAAGSAMANEFLQSESDRLRKQLEESEYALQRYIEDNNAVSLEERQNITVEKLREINLNVTRAKAERLRLESDLASAERAGGDPEILLSLQSIANSQDVLDVKRKITDQEAELANLSERYLPKHPRFIQATSQLAELREGLARAAINAASRLKTEYDNAKTTEEKLAESLKEQETAALGLNKLSVQYNILERQVQSDHMLYEAVMRRLGETGLAKGFDQSIFRVVELPYLPRWPSWPKARLIYLLCGVAGVLLGSAVILLTNLLDTSFKSVEMAEHQTGLDVIGAIPAVDATTVGARAPSALAKAFRACLPWPVKSFKNSESLFIADHPHSAVAESIRSLRTNLTLEADQHPTSGNAEPTAGSDLPRGKVILFTSAMPSEGKSFCAANYAASLAQVGLRTLLVDADLRRPMIGSIFEISPRAPGLGQILSGEPLDRAVCATRVDNLDVVTAGKNVESPAELLARHGLMDFLELARGRYDRIVIDSAPVNAVSDTLLLVHLADATCLVVWAAKTSESAVSRACAALRKARANLAGIVLNRMPASSGRNYNYYYADAEFRESLVSDAGQKTLA